MPKIILDLDAEDFNRLCNNSARWGNNFRDHESHFETIGADREISWDWRYAYWVGLEWTSVIFARSYLDSIGQRYQVVWDMVENPDMSYVILTDYPADWEKDGAAPVASPKEEDPQLWYTHWAYFASRPSAEACRDEMTGDGFDAVVTAAAVDPDQEADDDRWLLRATKEVYVNGLVVRHDYVETVVTRHGGHYDGGQMGRHDVETVPERPAADADESTQNATGPGIPAPWPSNTAVPPAGWQPLTDTDGTRPMGWFTTARDGMRTVVRGYATWDDAPFGLTADEWKNPTPEDLEHDETAIALHTIFDIAHRAYVFPDVATHAGPATHSFTNLDFCGGWAAAAGHGVAEKEALLARTVAGRKPASEAYFLEDAAADRDRWISAAHRAGLGALPYSLRMGEHIVERLWVAPARLADRVDPDALTAAWDALLAADPDAERRSRIDKAVDLGLVTAFALDLLQPLDPNRPYDSLPHVWWDAGTDAGFVALGAILGYPPASTYACMAERDGHVPLTLPHGPADRT